MRFISFFAGIGGMDLGLEWAGHTCVCQVEINPFCLRVLAKHWPDVPRWTDIREVDPNELPEADLYAGGDPCQANSNALKGASSTQPSLGGEFIRMVKARRPRAVLRENPSRIRADAPWPWRRFRAELEGLGYAVLPFRVRACCLGADHQRDRLFVLAALPDPVRPGLEGHEFAQMARAAQDGLVDITGCDRWSPAPRVCRGTDGVPDRVDRVRAIGNAVDPRVAEFIGRLLAEAAV